MQSSLPFWQQIDGVAVINLDHREDRWRTVATVAAQLPGRPAVTRIAACLGTALPGYGGRPWFRGRKTDGRWAARAGCMASHRRALLHARDAGWTTTLVLEDDCDLTPLTACDLDALHRLLFVTHPNWDVCYLGFSEIVPPAQRVAPWGQDGELLRVYGCLTTHAYLVRDRARDWILDHLPDEEAPWQWLSRNRAIDRWYIRNLSRRFTVVALSPALLLQKQGYSDIGQELVDWQKLAMRSVAPAKHGFRLRLRLAHTSTRLGSLADWIRGCVKRRRGF